MTPHFVTIFGTLSATAGKLINLGGNCFRADFHHGWRLFLGGLSSWGNCFLADCHPETIVSWRTVILGGDCFFWWTFILGCDCFLADYHPGRRLFLGGLSSELPLLASSSSSRYSSCISSILSRMCIGTLLTASPSGTEWELTARGERGAGLWFRARYSTVGDRCPSPMLQGRLGGLAQSAVSTIFRFSVNAFGRGGPGETHRAGTPPGGAVNAGVGTPQGGAENGGEGEGVELLWTARGSTRGGRGELPGRTRAGEGGAGRAGEVRLRTGEIWRGEDGLLEGWEVASSLSCGQYILELSFKN